LNIQIKIVDLDPIVIGAYSEVLKGDPWRIQLPGDIFTRDSKAGLRFSADAIISPANTEGNMDGGIDKHYTDFFFDIDTKVQNKIQKDFNGYLPIGKATLVPLEHQDFKYLIVSPTVETPTSISSYRNIYKASLAIFKCIKEYNQATEIQDRKIKSIVMPGLGTYNGAVHPKESAKAILYAWLDFLES
jgi:O-acetyl-ADP-ribose deacetylase (regulator of RNase III)